MNKDLQYLKHILECSESVLDWMRGIAFDEFIANDMLLSAVIRKLEIIGEASARITGEFKEANPSVPWRDMKAMRNKLIHEYDSLNLRAVFSTIHQDLPQLRERIAAFLQERDADKTP